MSALVGRAWRDDRGASAVEFAIIAAPFLFLILYILQVGIYYMTQAALDAGVTRTAENLRNGFTKASVTFPTAAALKTSVATNAGALVFDDARLSVEIRQLTNLSGSAVPVTNGTADYGSVSSALVLRATTDVVTFAPGFTAIAKASSSAIVRRQGR